MSSSSSAPSTRRGPKDPVHVRITGERALRARSSWPIRARYPVSEVRHSSTVCPIRPLFARSFVRSLFAGAVRSFAASEPQRRTLPPPPPPSSRLLIVSRRCRRSKEEESARCSNPFDPRRIEGRFCASRENDGKRASSFGDESRFARSDATRCGYIAARRTDDGRVYTKENERNAAGGEERCVRAGFVRSKPAG